MPVTSRCHRPFHRRRPCPSTSPAMLAIEETQRLSALAYRRTDLLQECDPRYDRSSLLSLVGRRSGMASRGPNAPADPAAVPIWKSVCRPLLTTYALQFPSTPVCITGRIIPLVSSSAIPCHIEPLMNGEKITAPYQRHVSPSTSPANFAPHREYRTASSHDSQELISVKPALSESAS
ncbi:hypothetical protein SERLA73DRAFT_77830 [Serpula lacrymans var. lacrymans S7.3]|uniref:Uncharacterized protein n=2 Tax=Serpula lacrymans var. lacrymans TaxID=341189 RepID=F8QB45_SERL3|nr:uncharacterized protein SERLADRAFT_442732 [Serpula lacrymans var. lacrymans S7.9]EGN94431.1 hypothetical protein SERLA73DRAFT_77830 [Serpula lacrymans var. lacrymans S7.3]EGO19918.1 hypothetical protein SERLADRAFT_442732 [Serpula lacrymans var. lacrymans S7.9]